MLNAQFESTIPKPDISIVIPVYSATEILAQLLNRISDTLSAVGHSFELILVDDRGNPESWRAIESLSKSDSRVLGIRLGRNFGQHAATMCGISHAKGQWVITMDEDLEHPPEAIPEMVSQCTDSQPLVYGTFPTRTHAWYRNLSSELMRWSLKKSFPQMNSAYTSFRAMRATLAEKLSGFDLSRPYIDGMLSWLTSSVGVVAVDHGTRSEGRSSYTLRRLLSHAINIFVTFSNLPLRLASVGGALLAVVGFLFLTVVIAGKLTGRITDPGYASLMSVVLFACGIQLMMLGLLGEYVGRLMGAANRKPVFSIQSISRSSTTPNVEKINA